MTDWFGQKVKEAKKRIAERPDWYKAIERSNKCPFCDTEVELERLKDIAYGRNLKREKSQTPV